MHILCCCFWELLAVNQWRFGCIHRAWCSAAKSWHWSPWSPGSSTAISAGQSTLASFLDAALLLQIVQCLIWRTCLFRSILGSSHNTVRGLYQVYFAQTKSLYFANSHFGHFTVRKLNYVLTLVMWEGHQHPNSCGPFSTLFDLMCILWSVA